MLSPLATDVFNHIEEINDPRLNRGLNHDLGEMMFLAFNAMHRLIDDFSDSLRGQGISIDGKTFAVRTTSGMASRRCGGKL
ncbi:MAG: hypothetical protein KDA68_07340 [Planctomycetaceae bacterium]|nr:hypothetical protein [Planctomycetaceae bacterium]